MRHSLPRVCITLPLGYSILNPTINGTFGGWEYRFTLIARELAKRGNFDVSMIVGDFGQAEYEVIDGIRLFSWKGRNLWAVPPKGGRNPFPKGTVLNYQWDRVIRVLRNRIAAFLPKDKFADVGNYSISYSSIAIYEKVNADIYLVPGNSIFSAEAASFCAQRNKKYLFVAGSDFDYAPEYKMDLAGADIYQTPHSLKVYSIERADAHVVQHKQQAKLLLEGYGRESVIIKNPIDLQREFPRSNLGNTILWVGKSDERVKRPSIALELAERLPEFQFVIIMNLAFPVVHTINMAKAQNLSNVKLIEQVPLREIERYFSEARVHVNTSKFEGFPNTYLQAAKYRVPTVSMNIDPGNMLSVHKAGLLSGENIDQLEADIRKLMTDDKVCKDLGDNAEEYIKTHHDKEQIIQQYEDVLYRVLQDGRI